MGFNEILIVLAIVLLLFGAKKIPELMRGVGRGMREFNDAKDSAGKELQQAIKEKDEKAAQTNSSTNL